MSHPVLQHIRILIVDHQRAMRSIVRGLLGQIGIREIVEADRADEAINQLVEGARFGKPIDLVITELHLQGMSGRELIEHLRQGGTADLDPTIPVLVLTGERDPVQLDEVRAAGASEILEKPIAAPELVRVIAHRAGIAISPKEIAALMVNTPQRSGSIRPGASGRMPR